MLCPEADSREVFLYITLMTNIKPGNKLMKNTVHLSFGEEVGNAPSKCVSICPFKWLMNTFSVLLPDGAFRHYIASGTGVDTSFPHGRAMTTHWPIWAP